MKKFKDEEWEEYLKKHQPKFEGNPEHLRILLEEGVEGWNKWRNEKKIIEPDLSYVDLSIISVKPTKIVARADTIPRLKGIMLSGVKLKGAILNSIELQNANLSYANLQNAELNSVNMHGANLHGTNLMGAELINADLRKANLMHADFSKAVITCIKYNKEIKIKNLVLWAHNSIESFRGISVDSCKGDAVFKRYAQDQDFLETFKETQPGWFYKPLYYLWEILSDCGQSIALWILWSVVIAVGFAVIFASLGIKSFNPMLLDFYDFNTLIYYSVVTFTTLGFGDITPATPIAARWVMAEVITGYIMLGGLISIFATKLARRS